MLTHGPQQPQLATTAVPVFSRFVPRHEDELYLEIDDPVLVLDRSEDLWCLGYNMRSGSTGIFPAFYTVEVTKEPNPGEKRLKLEGTLVDEVPVFCSCVSALKEGRTEEFLVRLLGSVPVPVHKGNSVLCAAMQKVDQNLLDLPFPLKRGLSAALIQQLLHEPATPPPPLRTSRGHAAQAALVL